MKPRDASSDVCPTFSAVVPAAGLGTRMGAGVRKPLLAYADEEFDRFWPLLSKIDLILDRQRRFAEVFDL